MLFADLPPQIQERVVCSISAAVRYEVPANIVLAVAEKEAGKPGQWVKNSNGTHDVGPMQFNTAYLASLARYGITASDVAAAGCYAYDLATWRLRQHIRHDQGDLWTKAANYHSRTPVYSITYRADLIRKAVKWADWLEAHFNTYDVLKSTSISSAPAQMNNTRSASPHNVAPAQVQPAPAYVPRQLVIN